MEANNEREEWVYLMLEAKNLGLSIEDVREFIKGKWTGKSKSGIKITLGKAVIQSSFFIFINVKGIQNKEHGDNNKKMQPYWGGFLLSMYLLPFWRD